MSHRNIRGGTVNVNMYVFSGNVVDVAILDQPQEDRTIMANKMKGATTAISSSRGGDAIRVALCLHVVGVARGQGRTLRGRCSSTHGTSSTSTTSMPSPISFSNLGNQDCLLCSVAPPFPPRHPPLLCALTKRHSPLWCSKVTSFLYSITAFQLTFGSLLNFACGIGGSRILT
jgi:hypothetical protein